jgi:hypothetical protein
MYTVPRPTGEKQLYKLIHSLYFRAGFLRKNHNGGYDLCVLSTFGAGRQDDLARTFEQRVSQENANDHATKQVGPCAVFDTDSVNFES